MINFIPVKVPIHKTRTSRLNSHLYELLFGSEETQTVAPKEDLRSKFVNVNLNTFYNQNTLRFKGKVI